MNKDQFLLRMKAIVLWLSILLFGCHLLYAQDEKAENSLGLQYGIHFLSRQDQLFSPMVYHAVSPLNGNLNFMNQKENRIHWAELEFNLYDASWHEPYNYQTGFDSIETHTTLPTGYTVVSLRYSFLKSVSEAPSLKLYAGGISDNQINAIDNQYAQFSTFGYFAHLSLAPVVKASYAISGKHQLEVVAWLPLISWISRSPYAVNDDEYMQDNADHNGVKTFFRYLGDGNIHLINRYQQFNLNVGYSYLLSNRWLIGAEYRFEFMRDTKPLTMISYQHFINLKTSFQF